MWKKITEIKEYSIWERVESDGLSTYQVTKTETGKPPADFLGGYYRLSSLLSRKGL